MLCSQDIQSAANGIARTVQAARPPEIGWRCLSSAMAKAMERQPPIRNDEIAAMKAHRNRSRRWPPGCVASAGVRSRYSPTARNTSFTESAAECAASASMPVDFEASPAINFAIAMTMLASNAITTVRVLSPSAALRRAVAERRWGRFRNLGPRSFSLINPDADGRSISHISSEPSGGIENTQTIFGRLLKSRNVGSELAQEQVC